LAAEPVSFITGPIAKGLARFLRETEYFLLRQQQPNLQATEGAVCAYLKGYAKTENTDRLARFVESPFVGRKLTLRSPREPKATPHSVERDVNLVQLLVPELPYLSSGHFFWRPPHIDGHVVRMGSALSGFHKFLQAQQENGPAHRAMRKRLRILLPSGVPEMQEGPPLVAENLEFDLGANPISCASVNHAPSHKVIGIERGHFDYRGAKAAKPEF